MANKVYVITGVSSGIGKALVSNILDNASSDDIVVGLGRSNISDFKNNRFVFIKTDLSKPDSIKNTIKIIKKNFGHVDVLVNNAGFGYRATIEDLSLGEIREQFEVNLFGPLELTKSVLLLMREYGGGHIINIGSVGSIVSTPTLGYYAATKASLDKISEVLEQEVSELNINVSTLVPGAVKTEFGKNIRLPRNYSKSQYKSLYETWQSRFVYFFKQRNTPEETAQAVWNLIEKPTRMKYLTLRDYFMCQLKQMLPYSMFQLLFLNYYYKYES